MARVAVGNDEEALDIVQDAMFKLARKYADKDEAQWPPLFQRILQNRITDWHRRNLVRRKLFSLFKPGSDEDVEDPVLQAPGPAVLEPPVRLELDTATQALTAQLALLPARQRQAFLLRNLEGLNVADTADAMNCSTGSVKTHYSRAVHTLRNAIGKHWS